ncbi:MAG: hypothetical protein L0211_17935 [Planctomycetaceae bacterium]|nr:hypothetical protein [Planctomycetaceae bacterium]
MTAMSKWTAFMLSACVPGAGQLAARSWTCLPWFAVTAGLVAALTHFGQRAGTEDWPSTVQIAAGIVLCLLSAEHAKRLLEQGHGQSSHVVSTKVSCAGGQRRSVDIAIDLIVKQSADRLWQQIRDLPRFLTIDPFHDKVILMRDSPAAGVDLTLSHNAFGWRFLRFGRILAWRENSGYSFSDLSARGPHTGFPHVFEVQIEPVLEPQDSPSMSRLTIRVRGRWTSRLVPVWIGRLWIRLVCLEHSRLLRKGL